MNAVNGTFMYDLDGNDGLARRQRQRIHFAIAATIIVLIITFTVLCDYREL